MFFCMHLCGTVTKSRNTISNDNILNMNSWKFRSLSLGVITRMRDCFYYTKKSSKIEIYFRTFVSFPFYIGKFTQNTVYGLPMYIFLQVISITTLLLSSARFHLIMNSSWPFKTFLMLM